MHDLTIIGTGPAGLSASIYASCFGLNHIVIGKTMGGQMALAPDILNYPGFEEISGKELTEKMLNHAQKRGAEIITDSVTKIVKTEQGFELTTETDQKYSAKAIILATGMERRKLNVPGEIEYTGKGIQYCATCDKSEYENKTAAVIGGANSAVQAAVQLSSLASKVYIIYRGDELRGNSIWLSQIQNNPKIEVIYNTHITEIIGNGQSITAVRLKPTTPAANGETGKELTVEKVFIEIGGVPGTALVIPLGVNIEPGGFIKVDENLATNVPGVYAAGDAVSHKQSIEQISSAVGLGAKAAMSAFSYLKGQKAPILWGTSQINR